MYEKVLWIFRKTRNKVVNFKKEKNEVIKKDHLKSYENAKICYICKEKLEDKYVKDKELRDRCHYYGEYRDIVHSICNLKYSVLKKNPVAIHYGSKYYYHFIVKKLVKEFKKHLLV